MRYAWTYANNDHQEAGLGKEFLSTFQDAAKALLRTVQAASCLQMLWYNLYKREQEPAKQDAASDWHTRISAQAPCTGLS